MVPMWDKVIKKTTTLFDRVDGGMRLFAFPSGVLRKGEGISNSGGCPPRLPCIGDFVEFFANGPQGGDLGVSILKNSP